MREGAGGSRGENQRAPPTTSAAMCGRGHASHRIAPSASSRPPGRGGAVCPRRGSRTARPGASTPRRLPRRRQVDVVDVDYAPHIALRRDAKGPFADVVDAQNRPSHKATKRSPNRVRSALRRTLGVGPNPSARVANREGFAAAANAFRCGSDCLRWAQWVDLRHG